ncbi:unnamed protein product, partial [marine sediment metagenome]
MGDCCEVEIRTEEELFEAMKKYEGFFEGELIEGFSKIPILPTKDEERRTVFGYGWKKGVIPFPEMRYGIKQNALQISYPCSVIIFKRGNFFGGFGKDTYAKRLKFIAEGNPLQFVLKIIMNSLYGKFGQKRVHRGVKYLMEKEYMQILRGEKTP